MPAMSTNEPPPDRPWQRVDSDEPEWNQDEADWMIGKYIVVGMTHLLADGVTVKEQVQYHGRIIKADRETGFEIACEGAWAGKTMTLPPLQENIRLAEPGKYRLRATGEEIEDPDFTSSWTITEPLKS